MADSTLMLKAAQCLRLPQVAKRYLTHTVKPKPVMIFLGPIPYGSVCTDTADPYINYYYSLTVANFI